MQSVPVPFPWLPIYSINRSDIAEVTVSGIISVVDGKGQSLVALGDPNYVLWTRSCLKPWQLLAHLPQLKSAYPKLQPAHFALMLSSHSGEKLHLEKLDEVSTIGDVDQSLLQCPPSYPMAQADRVHAQDKGDKQTSRCNNCSGKHMGYLLAMKAKQLPLTDYLNPQGIQFEPLKNLIRFLIGKADFDFPVTTDGCRLPNYAFSIADMAKLYARLVSDYSADEIKKAPAEIQPMLQMWSDLRSYMHDYPEIVGGKGRLDTRIMQEELTNDPRLSLLAKQGADGLLSIAVSPTTKYPDGLGIVIKLASGTDMHHMETIVKELFHQLGFRDVEKPDPKNAHLQNRFYFSIKALTCKTTS